MPILEIHVTIYHLSHWIVRSFFLYNLQSQFRCLLLVNNYQQMKIKKGTFYVSKLKLYIYNSTTFKQVILMYKKTKKLSTLNSIISSNERNTIDLEVHINSTRHSFYRFFMALIINVPYNLEI